MLQCIRRHGTRTAKSQTKFENNNSRKEQKNMNLTRWHRPELSWSPFRQLSSLRDEIDRLFEAPLSSLTELSQPFSGGWVPAVDVYEDKDNYVVKMELPG